MALTNTGISHADLTPQQIDDIARRIKLDVAQDKPDFEEVFTDKVWPEGKESVNYRVLIHQAISKDEVDSFTLKEFTAPTSRGLKYANFSEHTTSYGTDYEYSWEDIEGNADDIIPDIKDELKGWTLEMLTFIYGKALLSTRSTMKKISAGDGSYALLKAYRRARMIFTKLGINKWNGGQWLAYVPVEVSDKLSEEHIAAYGGKDLPQKQVMEDIDGYCGSFKGFTIKNPAKLGESVLVNEVNGVVQGYYMIFVGLTPTSRKPGERFHKAGESGIEVIPNPLGSGVVEDANGKIKNDNNHQKGSVAENMKYVSAHILDDRAVLKIYIDAAYITNDLNTADDMANIDSEVAGLVAHKVSTKGAYAETQGTGDKEVAASPFGLVGADSVVVGSAITLTASQAASKVTTSDASKATATLAADKVTITVTGVAAGDVEIEAFDAASTDSDVAFITVKAA